MIYAFHGGMSCYITSTWCNLMQIKHMKERMETFSPASWSLFLNGGYLWPLLHLHSSCFLRKDCKRSWASSVLGVLVAAPDRLPGRISHPREWHRLSSSWFMSFMPCSELCWGWEATGCQTSWLYGPREWSIHTGHDIIKCLILYYLIGEGIMKKKKKERLMSLGSGGRKCIMEVFC